MASTLPDAPTDDKAPADPELMSEEEHDALPDASVLDDKMPEWFRLTVSVPIYTLLIGFVGFVICNTPLYHSDLWGHLSYGRYIVQNGLPATEPLMPLAEGMAFTDTAWLSQVLGYGLASIGQAATLQFLHALSVVICLSCLIGMVHRKTGRITWSLVSGIVFLTGTWALLTVIRPQLAGLACFSVLLWMLTARRHSVHFWWAIPVLFVAWANLHGSFLVGIATLGAFTIGRGIDLVRRTGTARSLLHDDRVRRLLLLTELAAVAVLVNPYGLELYATIWNASSNPNMTGITEWDPWTLRDIGGWPTFLTVVGLVMLYRLSPRRVRTSEVLLLVGLGAAMLHSYRMIIWWFPVAAYLVGVHGAAWWRRFRSEPVVRPAREAGSKWTIAALGLVWIFFAITPMGRFAIHGKPKPFTEAVSDATPVGAIRYLHDEKIEGLIYNNFSFGDFLLWAGPESAKPFMASHVQYIPRDIWIDFQVINTNRSDWQSQLERYGINTLLLHPDEDYFQAKRLRNEPDTWTVGYEDNAAIIFRRRTPL